MTRPPIAVLLLSLLLPGAARAELEAETLLRALDAHAKPVRAAAMTPLGDVFASGGEDGKASLWPSAGQKPPLSSSLSTHPVTGAAFSPDGRLAAFSDASGAVYFLSPLKGGLLAQTTGLGEVSWLGFSADGRPSKLAFARSLAAALGYLALRQGDAAGLTAFAAAVSTELPPRAKGTHLLDLLGKLVRLSPSGPTAVARCIDRIAERARRRSVVILLSDLLDPDPTLTRAFRRLVARRHDVAVLQILDPAERAFPYEVPSLFLSMEDDRRLFVHPRVLRERYVAEMERFLRQVREDLTEAGTDYHLITTDAPPERVLGAFLRNRERRRQ